MTDYIVAVVDVTGVRSGRVEPNKEVLTENGFLICDQVLTTLTPEEAASIRGTSSQEFDFTSGPVLALLLQRQDSYSIMRQIQDTQLDNLYASVDSWTTLRDKRVFFPSTPRLERTMVLVKPEYSQEDYNRILQTIDENDFVLIGKLARIVTADTCAAMFNENKDDMEYVGSGVSVALVIEKMGAVDDWQLLMGPKEPSIAAVVGPTTLRGCLGVKSRVKNVLYGSESVEKANRDIAALFPYPFAMERTFALIKPDVVRNGHLDAVMQTIKANGFAVLASEQVNLSQRRAEQFFGQTAVAAVSRYMSSGPAHALILGKPGAVVAWQKIVGPTDPADARQSKPQSLSARFGADALCNGFHASESAETAKEEINFFFPQIRVEQLPTLLQVEDALNKKPAPRPHVEAQESLLDVLTNGLTQLCRVKPMGNDAVKWLAEWLLRNNPNKPAINQPVVEQPTIGILDSIAAATGSKVDVVWALGGPGSGRDENVTAVADTHGYELIDTAELLVAASASGSEYGELLNECKTKGRAVPTHVPVNLVKAAMMSASGVSKFMVKGFPSSLDEAMMFENLIGEANKIVYFDCTDATKAKRVDLNDDDVAEGIKAFKKNVYPVVDQYQLYGKVSKVSTDGSAAQIQATIKQIFGR